MWDVALQCFAGNKEVYKSRWPNLSWSLMSDFFWQTEQLQAELSLSAPREAQRGGAELLRAGVGLGGGPAAGLSWTNMHKSLMSPVEKSSSVASESSNAKEKLFYVLSEEMAILALAFVGGYVDCAGYIKLGGLFTSSITGNLVAACASIYHNDGAVARACVSIAFAFAAALAVFAILRLKLVHEWSKKSIAILLFIVEAVILIVSMTVGLPYDHDISSDGAMFRWPLVVVGTILGAAMGVHNAVAKEYIPNCPATTVMTMTLVSISIGWAQMVTYAAAHYLGLSLLPPGKALPPDHSAQILQKVETSTANFNKVVKPLLAFLAGAIIATVITMYASFWSIAVAVAICLWMAFDIALTILIASPARSGGSSTACESGGGNRPPALPSPTSSPTLPSKGNSNARTSKGGAVVDVESLTVETRARQASGQRSSVSSAHSNADETLFEHVEDQVPREEEPTLPIMGSEADSPIEEEEEAKQRPEDRSPLSVEMVDLK